MDNMDEWIALAQKELKGNSLAGLSKKWEDYTIRPYYVDSKVSYNIEKKQQPYFNANGWLNLPKIEASSADAANAAALNHLQNGADGIIFKCPGPNFSCGVLLKEIEPQFCFLGFESGKNGIQLFQELQSALNTTTLRGAIFWSEQPNWLSVANLFKGYGQFRCLGFYMNGDRRTNQLIDGFNQVISVIDNLTDNGFNASSVFNQLAFSFTSSSNFFLDVASFKACRILIARLAQAYSVSSTNSFIRVETNTAVPQVYQPHGDLLSAAFSSVAGVMASVDAMTIMTDNPNSALHTRTARNISLLLKEESKLDQVVDPLAGSYFVDTLTHDIAEHVWELITLKS